MGIIRTKQQVRDGFLRDLPEDIQKKVMGVNKLVAAEIDEKIDKEKYEDLTKSRWAMSCLDDFKTVPTATGEVGSVRVYKAGKQYKCIIHVTGHFMNTQWGWIEELLDSIIKDTFQDVRGAVRKKYDVTLVNEGDKGNTDEGFAIQLSNKDSKMIWEKFEGMKTRTITESTDVAGLTWTDAEKLDNEVFDAKANYLRPHVDKLYEIYHRIATNHPDASNRFAIDDGWFALLTSKEDGKRIHNVQLYGWDVMGIDESSKAELDKMIGELTNVSNEYIKANTIGNLSFDDDGDDGNLFWDIDEDDLLNQLPQDIQDKKKIVDEFLSKQLGESADLINYYESYRGQMTYDQYFYEKSNGELQDHPKKTGKTYEKPESYRKESSTNTPEYNVDMTEAQAKKTLRTLSQDIINKSKDEKYKVTQYTANIYANIITKNLIQKWSSGYKKLSITLDSYQSFLTFEFKIPTMTQDFISRFINGREPMNAFLHRVPEIKIKMSPRIFHTMQDPDDAYNFFRAAIKYYDTKVERYAKSLMHEVMKLNHSMKHLISTTKLSGIVTCPMQLLFVFDDVHMNNAQTFLLTDDDLKAVNNFMKNIYTRYAAPEKEKTKIVEDVKSMVKELREACDQSDNMKDLYYLPEAVETYLTGGYDKLIAEADELFIREQVDQYAMQNPADNELRYIREKFGVKKLKRIPTDLVAYISIETEAIESANDKMMIASYCLSKIEIVEWYIELLEVGSKKYIVPHSKPYLENVRTQLLACYKKIMDTKIVSQKNRPLIDIQYPKGYEG